MLHNIAREEGMTRNSRSLKLRNENGQLDPSDQFESDRANEAGCGMWGIN